MKSRYFFVSAFFLSLLLSLSQCGGAPKPKKKLTDNVRPLQLGTEISLGSDSFDPAPDRACSFGFYAARTDQTPAPEGLVTALHCTNMRMTAGVYDVPYGEPIWQSRPENSGVIAEVRKKPEILRSGESRDGYDCPYWWDRNDVDYCIPADAAFAEFDPSQDTWQGAVANVPLSIDQTELTLVDEAQFDEQSGVLTDPLPGEFAYKIGKTTGKTRMYVVEEVEGQFTQINGENVVYLRLFRAVDMWDDPVPHIDHGDSGGPVFHNFRDAHDGYILAGIAVGGSVEGGTEVLYIEPVSDIKRMLPVEPKYAGSGGVMHAGVGQ